LSSRAIQLVVAGHLDRSHLQQAFQRHSETVEESVPSLSDWSGTVGFLSFARNDGKSALRNAS
jgi:hypothetical protein